MGEERLIGIAKEICMTNDPIWTMGYISSLGASDIYLLFKYVRASRHYNKSNNIYDVIYNFSCDYLISKGIPIPVTNIDFVMNGFNGNADSHLQQMDYFNNMLAGDDLMKFVGVGSKK